MPKPLRIALTPGDPAGIGFDITLQCLSDIKNCDVVIFSDKNALAERAQQLQCSLPDNIQFRDFKFTDVVECGKPNPKHAQTLLDALDAAVQGCLNGDYDAIVTGPINKQCINEAGIAFSGHTEFLMEKTACDDVVMMLACDAMRVALVTTHLPLAKVPSAITQKKLQSVIEILYQDCQTRLGLPAPRIAVTGLNPHAGEGGYLGREEIETIIPVIQQFQEKGLAISGPYPADTIFTSKHLAQCDVVLAMYHDQGLPVLKYAGFGEAANITLGLPIIRTSVDHGTAYDIAGSGKANANSLRYAIDYAIAMVAAARGLNL